MYITDVTTGGNFGYSLGCADVHFSKRINGTQGHTYHTSIVGDLGFGGPYSAVSPPLVFSD